MGTNYRTVYKSDHLGVIDLEEMIESGKSTKVTIKEVKQYILDPSNKNSGVLVAGKRITANIAFFVEDIKPLVLNSTNAKMLRVFAGSSLIENWTGLYIELYADPTVKMKGEVVGGVRIKPTQPNKTKPAFTSANFEAAKKAKATIEKIKAVYTITPEVEAEYLKYYGAEK